MKKTLSIIFTIFIIAGTYLFFQKPSISVNSFQECIAAGNPAMESYPRRCIHEDQSFTEDIGNQLELEDQIQVYTPRPGGMITNPQIISGKIRGTWFFEASFLMQLLDEQGDVVSESLVTTDEEWMTEDFVPFSVNFEFTPSGENIPGKLILIKDNPSGIRELDNHLEIPVLY